MSSVFVPFQIVAPYKKLPKDVRFWYNLNKIINQEGNDSTINECAMIYR